MSKWIIALTTVTVASASASTYFWQELREEREQRATLQTRIAELEQARESADLPAPIPEPVAEEPPTAATTPSPAPAPTARLAVASGAAFSAVPLGRPGAVDPEIRRRMFESHEQQIRMLKDPEYRELMRAQQKLSLQQHYSDLEALLGLSKEESEQLLEVLAEHSVRSMEQRPMIADANGGPPSESEMNERRRMFEEQRRKNDSEIAAVLGSKFNDWQQYQQNGWARSQVSQLRQSLSSGGEPLRQDQVKPLVEAIAREQKQTMRSMTTRPYSPNARPDPMTQVQQAEEWLERTAQSHERIRAAVSGLLTPSQYEQFERQQRQELRMQELSVRQQRARAEAQARGELPADPTNVMMQAVTTYAQ